MAENTKNRIKDKQTRGQRGLGYLFKRGRNYWLEFRVAGKRQRVPVKDDKGKSVTTQKVAEEIRKVMVAPFLAENDAEAQRQLIARLQSAEAQAVEAKKALSRAPLISDVWQEYLEAPERSDSGPRTLQDYQGYWNAFEKWLGRSHEELSRIDEVTRGVAGEYAKYLSKQGRSANRFNKHATWLKSMFKILVPDMPNPFDGIKRKRAHSKSRRELTIEELTAVLATAKGEIALLMGLGLFTGLRLGDCATLRWGEVDLAREIIKRIPNKTKSRNQSAKPVTIGIPRALHERLSCIPLKERTGYVCPESAIMYVDMNRRPTLSRKIQSVFLQCGIDIHEEGTGLKILRDENDLPVRDKSSGEVQTERETKRAVVEVGFHSLRHTFVSLCREANTPLAVVEAIVGHSNPTMTRLYTHTGETAILNAAKALSALTGASGGKEEPQAIIDAMPDWVIEGLKGMTDKNWKAERERLLKMAEEAQS